VHIVGMFCFTAQNRSHRYKKENLVRISQVKLLAGFPQNFSGEWLVPSLVVHIAGIFCFTAQNGYQS
jgi:hypothetical protein